MKKIATKSPYTEQQINLIKNTVAKDATPDELKLFLYTAARTGLDPLTNQIHFVKRGGQATVQTGIDGYRAIAAQKGDLAGIEDAVYDTETEKHPNKATVTVYRIVEGQRVPFTASARWAEYAPLGSQAFMWNKMPYLMLAKCAEALALRKAFPNDLSGVYTDEEMHQADIGRSGRQQAFENGLAEGGEEECYCTLCGERGVRGMYGYYCPNYRKEDHRTAGKRNWQLVYKEGKGERQEEKQKEEEKEPF